MKLIPIPKKIRQGEKTLSLSDISIFLCDGCDQRLTRHAVTLKNEIVENIKTPVAVKNLSAEVFAKKEEKGIYISHKNEQSDAYTLTISENRADINAASGAGAFYAIQTLRQILREYPAALPEVTIEDEPDFKERGFYHDVTRGRVPTLSMLKKIAEELSFYKINQLQLYVEDAFDFVELEGIVTKHDLLTAEEILDLDDFCYNHFIELVPSLSTFGHLYNLLQSEKYKHLCEYENYKPTQVYWLEKMGHHTIDVSNEESIALVGSLIDQYVPLFRSEKFNICCDETFDLCRGRNAGKDSGEEYFKFHKKIIDRVKAHGKTVQMWGDIVLNHQEKMNELPKDTVMLNWCYEKEPNEENVKTFAKSGLAQIVCPGTSSWNRFIEEIDRSFDNISNMAKYGHENGAVGILNTNWGDFGNICPWNAEKYGMVIGAERGWTAQNNLDEDFERAASDLLYDSKEENIIRCIIELGRAERTCDWMHFVYWFSANTVEGRTTTFEVDPKKATENIEKCEEILKTLDRISASGDDRIEDLKLAARAIQLMNREVMMINHVGDIDRDLLKKDFSEWMAEYKTAWLRENKISQINLIEKFINEIVELGKE